MFTFNAGATVTRGGGLPERAILLWQSFESPFLLLRCLLAKDEGLLGSGVVRAAGLSIGAGRDRLLHRRRWSVSKAAEPLSSRERLSEHSAPTQHLQEQKSVLTY